jgi:hypothetical protein
METVVLARAEDKPLPQRIFTFCFLCFLAAPLIRIAPNGLESLAFSLTLVSAVTLVVSQYRSLIALSVRTDVLVLCAPWLLLGFWYALGIDWITTGIWSASVLLFEYRLLVCIPLFAVALFIARPRPELIIKVGVVSSAIGVLMLYLFQSVWVSDVLYILRPRGSHIISGSIAACTVILAWFAIQHLKCRSRSVGLLIIITAAYVLFWDTGRTGYLQAFFMLSVVLLSAGVNLKFKVWALIAAVTAIGVLLLSSDNFTVRVHQAALEASRFFEGERESSSAGLRLQWTEFALRSLDEHWLTGVGLDGYNVGIQRSVESGHLLFATTNLHSEVANALYIGGVPGLGFFVACLVSWLALKNRLPRAVYWFGFALSGTVIISSVFNSAFKDFGEKNLWMTLWPLFIYLCVLTIDRKNEAES